MNSLKPNGQRREEYEEEVTMKVREMHLKNRELQKRFEEVEKDRLEAEKQCAAVTSNRYKTLVTNKYNKNNKLQNSLYNKPEREWDIGKGAEGGWNTKKENDYHLFRNFRRGQSYRNKKDGYFQQTQRYQHSGRGNHSSGDDYKKLVTQEKLQNPESESRPRYDAEAWLEDGVVDMQRKNERVEKWVKAVNSIENWTENGKWNWKSHECDIQLNEKQTENCSDDESEKFVTLSDLDPNYDSSLTWDCIQVDNNDNKTSGIWSDIEDN